ncbi:cytochrome d ubiquinol oxidase subunit II [Parasulfuritortus cantonensis]|uniref:Cytochrome d ubiquinol oxidase subunit II n=1 Tax=Parasulfuritortus cantonensis TaxID=2528202 RepID=A0A4R1BDM8_9PROT|nr:cytochrome d ubiquinol oxidase subunit II [Parasulfuritortus cantonensis]TCJ15098.1 cytochrome d ubiquinol oxidase subunit II [Parasulfuritortus cantonensis]
MLDYETLKIIWWLLVGVLLLGFAVMDGHDMGVGTLLPFVGKNDVERRVIINTVGPHWDGNQVWFITGGGAIFAAWPLVYATAFSGFYWAMLAVLWALFFRPVGFDYRSKVADPRWRTAWDWGLFVGGAVPALIFGVAFGNLLQGVPFHFEDNLMPVYTGSFWALLNPFALLAGVVSLAMLTCHGAHYLMIRTEGAVYERAKAAALIFGLVMLAGFAAAGVWVTLGISGYVITSAVDPSALPNPLDKTVEVQAGAWLANFAAHPLLWLVPGAGFLGGLFGLVMARADKPVFAFVGSAVAELGIIGTAGVAMFPFVMPSSSDPRSSLTAWDSVSSHLTLDIMFWAALIFTPIVISYTGWAYKKMAGKVTTAYIQANDHSAY